MSLTKRGQISIEYLMIIGFITFVVLAVLGLAFLYTTQINDSLKVNQVESFANQLISSAESIYFAGAPSLTTINLHLPDGVSEVSVHDDTLGSGSFLVIKVMTASGENVMGFKSRVKLQFVNPNPVLIPGETSSGIKRLRLEATSDQVIIS